MQNEEAHQHQQNQEFSRISHLMTAFLTAHTKYCTYHGKILVIQLWVF